MEEHCKQQIEAIFPLLTEEGNGQEVVEDPQKLILKPFPKKLNPSATAQALNSPLPATPSPDPMHILLTPTAHSTPETPTIKAIPFALHVHNFRKLVAYVQTFRHWQLLILHGTVDGRYQNHLGSDLEHLYLSDYTSSTSSNSLQRLKKLIWGDSVSPTFCFDFFLFYFILF